jgi:DNA-3-methyladenine glycosylase
MFRIRPTAKRESDLCSGPGKLGAALAIDRTHDGIDLVTSPALFIERARKKPLAKNAVTVSPRIGIDYAGDWAIVPLRFHLTENPHVSKR